MEVLNRIKNTVSSFSTVLPGNPVTREYEVIEHIGSAGPGLLWKVYKGIKKSTKEEAAVFVLEKKLLEKYLRTDRDYLLDIMKKGIASLTRLRHPSILTVQHPLEESRESLAFATEPVFASLANILGNKENMPSPLPKGLENYKLYDIEIKYGLFQIIEGLTFLHNDVKMLHRNLIPESIMVNKNGAWKLAGFDFSVQSATSPGSQEHFPFTEFEMDRPPCSQPNLDYIAPEYFLTLTCSTASDMFSYGALIYAIYNKGKTVVKSSGSNMSMKHQLKELQHLQPNTFNSLPEEFREHVKLLLNVTPEIRPDAFQTSKLPMFEDVGVKTLQYLDSLYQWDNLQKSHFYRGLPQIIVKMPKRVALFRVLPCLVKEYCVPEMVPFVLPSVLLIAEDVTKEQFQQHVLSDMVPLFRLQEPVQILLIFMQKMELLLKKCSPAAINNHILPMIYRALEADAQQIQELCLSIIPRFAGLIEYPAMKNALIPRIKKLCICTSFLSVRVNCLVCIGKLLEHLDKWLVLDEILPFLPQIPSKEPAVLMGILGILKLTMSHKKLGITKEVMATKTIPFLMPLSIENGLTLNQFNAVMSVVKEMVCRVEAEHKTKLEQLNSIRQEQSSAISMTQLASGDSGFFPDFPQSGKNATTDVFQDLGLSSFVNPNSLSTKNDDNVAKSSDFLFNNTSPSGKESPKALSLSLEEKKKLAWEQEQQHNFKTQQNVSLAPSISPTKPANASGAQSTDAMLNKLGFGVFGSHPGNQVSSGLVMNHTSPIGQNTMSQPFSNIYRPANNMAMPTRQNSQKMVPSVNSMDLSSLDNLLPSLGRSSQSMNQMVYTNTPISSQQSISAGCQLPWPHSSGHPTVRPMSPPSGPQSLPTFSEPIKNPVNDINDLLG